MDIIDGEGFVTRVEIDALGFDQGHPAGINFPVRYINETILRRFGELTQEQQRQEARLRYGGIHARSELEAIHRKKQILEDMAALILIADIDDL